MSVPKKLEQKVTDSEKKTLLSYAFDSEKQSLKKNIEAKHETLPQDSLSGEPAPNNPTVPQPRLGEKAQFSPTPLVW